MFPTAYPTATLTEENVFLVVPAVLLVTRDKQRTQGASIQVSQICPWGQEYV